MVEIKEKHPPTHSTPIKPETSKDLIEELQVKICKDEYIDGLTAPEAVDFLIKNFSMTTPNEIFSKYGIRELKFINHIFYTGNMDFRNMQEKTIEEFETLLASLPEDKQRELLNNVYAGVNGHTYITMYNQDYIMELQSIQRNKTLEEAELEYFEGIDRKEIPNLYKRSTLSHEIAHNIRHNDIYIDKDKLLERQEIIKEYKSLTKYAEMYNQEKFTDEEGYVLYLNENFAEAVRMYTVNPKYVEKIYPKVYTFIKTNFPFIQSI